MQKVLIGFNSGIIKELYLIKAPNREIIKFIGILRRVNIKRIFYFYDITFNMKKFFYDFIDKFADDNSLLVNNDEYWRFKSLFKKLCNTNKKEYNDGPFKPIKWDIKILYDIYTPINKLIIK